MNWFKEIKLQSKDAFSRLLQSRITADNLQRITHIAKDLPSKLHNQYSSYSSKLHNYYTNYFSHNISSNDNPDTSGLNSPQTDCDILFRMRKSSKIDREQVTQMIENKAAEHPTEMNLPIYNRQESFIEVIVNWICSTKHLSPRDIKLAVNILKHEDSINKKNINSTDTTPVNNKISYIIKDFLINKYTGDDWYQMISHDKKIKIALSANDDKSKIIDLCFQRYQKFNQKDILKIITSNIDDLYVSPQNINTVYNHVQSTKNYDNSELSFFMNLLKQSSNERAQLSDDLVSKVCKLLFHVYKSSNVNVELKHRATKTIENLVDIYPKALGYNTDNTQKSFIDMITSSVKHSAPQKMMIHNSPQDKRKYDSEAKFFINLIQSSIKNNSNFSSKEGSKIVELLFNMYNSPTTSTVIHDNSVIILQKFIDQHPDLATIPLSHSKCSLGQLIAKSIEKKGIATIHDVQLATSVISNIDSEIHTKRTLLEILVKKYKHADKQKVLAEVIDAASPKELNLADVDGNTFGHFFIKQYQQPNKYGIELLQQLLQSNKLNIAAQNNNGATILHLLNLNSYDDRILALEVLKNSNHVDIDLYCLADKNGNKFIVNIIKSFLSGNNGLNEIINLALNACPDSFLSILADMCNNSNLSKYTEIIDIIKPDNNAADVKLYYTKFLKQLSEQNREVARTAEEYLTKYADSSASNYDYADENHSPVYLIPPSAPEQNYHSNIAYPNLGEIMQQNIEVYG